MGYNIKCYGKSSVANCMATCKKTRTCKIAEYAKGSKTCCLSAIATKKACKGSFTKSSSWAGYVVCGAPKATTKPKPTLPGTKLVCGSVAGPICMGYNIKCYGKSSVANCMATCKKTRTCKIAEYAKGSKTCCLSAIATKKECKGSFTKSSSWAGYVVCGAPKATTKPKPKLPGTSLTCDALAGPICMGYNMKCFRTSLTGCKAECKKTPGCKIAEYSTGGTCCTSRYATKKTCPGSFSSSSSWKGYVVCGSPKEILPHSSLKCDALAGPICMGYNIKCFRSSLDDCKKTCARTADCRIAEYSTTGTCCTSKYATKATCPGSFTTSKSWKGYVVCGAPVTKLAGTSLKCGALAGPICMGYNLRCFRTSLANCKAECKKHKDCKIAEYSTGGTCCTSKYATKKTCPGSFTSSKSWKGYVVC